jgi:hypothetical protein
MFRFIFVLPSIDDLKLMIELIVLFMCDDPPRLAEIRSLD